MARNRTMKKIFAASLIFALFFSTISVSADEDLDNLVSDENTISINEPDNLENDQENALDLKQPEDYSKVPETEIIDNIETINNTESLNDEVLYDTSVKSSIEKETSEETDTQTLTGSVYQKMIDGKKYFEYADGSRYYGWIDLGGEWILYCDPNDNGAAVCGTSKYIDDELYLFDQNGLWINKSGTPVINGNKYWVNAEGKLETGWLYLTTWKMYFDPSTGAAGIGMSDIDGYRYLFNSDGVMTCIPGTPVVDGNKYWFSTEGYLQTGWLNLLNWRLYFDPSTYTASVGLKEIEGKHYIFDTNGVLYAKVGTPVVEGYKYWFNEDGSLNSGWLHLGDWEMYFDPVTFRGAVGYQEIDGENYFFDDNGVLISKGEVIDQNNLDKYFKINEISDAVFSRIYGDNKSFKTYCTVSRDDLRYLELLYVGFDGKTHRGELIVNKLIANDIIKIFKTLYQCGYQINSIKLVDDFNADDIASVAANNTSAFNYRRVENSADISNHSYGLAIDINPINNPYLWYDENGNLVGEDPDWELYVDRETNAAERHVINEDDLCYKLFKMCGFTWGGEWGNPIDYQHFQKIF